MGWTVNDEHNDGHETLLTDSNWLIGKTLTHLSHTPVQCHTPLPVAEHYHVMVLPRPFNTNFNSNFSLIPTLTII